MANLVIVARIGARRSAAAAAIGGAAAFATSTTTPVECFWGKEAAPKNIKVYYGDMPFWRAECVRMALFIGGVKFDDCRDKKRDELNAEGKLPFSATPVLEVDGKILSQTQAMASYASGLAGMKPRDAWGQAKVDEAINGCTDCTVTIGGTFRLAADQKIPERQKLIAPGGRLHMQLTGIERLIKENGSTGFIVGKSLTVADLALWRMVGWISGGVIDGIPKDFVSTNFPQITQVCASVDSNAKVKEWKQLHAKFYDKRE